MPTHLQRPPNRHYGDHIRGMPPLSKSEAKTDAEWALSADYILRLCEPLAIRASDEAQAAESIGSRFAHETGPAKMRKSASWRIRSLANGWDGRIAPLGFPA